MGDYQLLEAGDLNGFTQLRSEAMQRQSARVDAATALWADVMSGSLPVWALQEAIAPRTPEAIALLHRNYGGVLSVREGITTSDFPMLTGGVISRMALGEYRAYPQSWRQFVSVRNNLRDFRSNEALYMDGLEGAWPEVEEGEEISYAAPTEGKYTLKPAKRALGVKLSFETIINDDLGQFMSVPQRLGRGGARSVARAITKTYVGSSGPLASFYKTANKNVVTGNPELSIEALQAAMLVLAAQTDADGEPIVIEAVTLVVPPALEIVARNILNAVQIELTQSGGTSGEKLTATNWMRNRVTLVVDPYISVIASSNGTTSWFLFADANSERPAIQIGFVRGFGEPQIYRKAGNTALMAGGVAQEMGDFGTMSQEYKGVMAFGTALMDPKMSVASNGSGS